MTRVFAVISVYIDGNQPEANVTLHMTREEAETEAADRSDFDRPWEDDPHMSEDDRNDLDRSEGYIRIEEFILPKGA